MNREKVDAVVRMQNYIVEHPDEATPDGVAAAAGYSKFHAVRVFKELTGHTPSEFARAIRLTRAAETLRDTDSSVLDVALDSGFDSHDGFTRAFTRQFGIQPARYSRETPPVRYFVPYTIEAYYAVKDGVKPMAKEPISRTMTVTAIQRPARKLLLLRSKGATEYFSYCEEVGCDWDGLFNSIPERFDTAALLTLPDNLVKAGYGKIATGVEVPLDYNKPLPDGCEMIELPPCIMLYFVGAPFEDEGDFGAAIGTLWEIMDTYDPTRFGWQYAPQLAPYFNFGTVAKSGAKMAMPAEMIANG